MKEIFEKILERLEEKRKLHAELSGSNKLTFEERQVQARFCGCFCSAKQIVREVAEEYSYLSEEFDSGLLKRIADYFSSVYDGDDKTAPKMELSVYDLRYIANLHVEKCRLQAEGDNLKKSHTECNNGWIPCNKMLPSKVGWYLVSREDGKVDASFWFEEETWKEGHNSKVLAWQPLPESFKEMK